MPSFKLLTRLEKKRKISSKSSAKWRPRQDLNRGPHADFGFYKMKMLS